MIIRLPTNFIYTSRGPSNCAYVKNGILYVEGFINYEDLMYTLTYELYGYEKCYFCGVTLNPRNRTLDHLYPRSWGGISITDNLRPSCRNCNGMKSDMTELQFEEFQKLELMGERHDYYQSCLTENEKIIQKQPFILPQDWVVKYDASELIHSVPFKYLEKSKMEKLEEYYNRYGHYRQPILVSSNNWLFKGKHNLRYARKINQPIVPAIILENVVVIMNTS